MKIKYKILLIILTSIIVYILFHSVLLNLCMTLINDGKICNILWLYDTSIHITNHNWDAENGISNWSGTAEGVEQESIIYDDLKMNSGFIFWHVILPTFTILLIYQRDRLKN